MRGLRKLHDDRGTTLMELLVGMALMAAFMVMFTGAIVLMSRSVNKVEAVAASSDEVNAAFLQLDRTIRYAAAISAVSPPAAGGDWHVEFDTTTTGTEVCTQLRVHAGQLQRRSWSVSGTGYSALSPWTALASNITNGSAAASSSDQPFSVPPAAAAASSSFQRLTVTLVASSDSSTPATSRSAMTFTAINSNAGPATSVCTQVGVEQTS